MELTGNEKYRKEGCGKRIGRGAALALALLLVMPLAASVSAQDEQTGKVYGYVYGQSGGCVIMIYPPPEGTETPLEGANVSIRMSTAGAELPSTDGKTDKEGYFEFDNLVAGDYDIIISAEGYEGKYDKFSVSADDNKSLGRFVLNRKYEQPAPDARIFGYVKDSKTSEGIKGVSISIYGGYTGERYGGSGYAVTDRDGHYEMDCWSGDNWISAYDNSGRYNQYSEQVNVSQGDFSHDILMEPKPPKTAKVSGHVYDSVTGKPVWVKSEYPKPVHSDPLVYSAESGSEPGYEGDEKIEPSPQEEYHGAYVYLSNQENQDWNYTENGKDGYFEMDTYPGYTSINVWADGYYSWETCVDLADSGYSADIYLKPHPLPDCILSGTVVNLSSGKPIAGAYVSAWNEETYGYGSNQTDEKGRYEIKLVHGWNHVSIWVDGYFYYSAAIDLPANERTQKNVQMKPGGPQYYLTRSDTVGGGREGGNAPMPASGQKAGLAAMQDSMKQQSSASGLSGGYALNQNVKVDIKGEGGIGGLPGFEVMALAVAIGVAMFIGRIWRRK